MNYDGPNQTLRQSVYIFRNRNRVYFHQITKMVQFKSKIISTKFLSVNIPRLRIDIVKCQRYIKSHFDGPTPLIVNTSTLGGGGQHMQNSNTICTLVLRILYKIVDIIQNSEYYTK